MKKIIVASNLFLQNGDIPADILRAFTSLYAAANECKYGNVVISVSTLADEHELIKSKFSGYDKLHFGTLASQDKLPKIAEIVDSALSIAEDQDLMVSINSDINVPYYFFDLLIANAGMVGDGSGLIINRKDLLSDDPDIFNGSRFKAVPHLGFDCMAFPVRAAKQFCLGTVTIGLPPVGALIVCNMLAVLEKVVLLNDALLTWHEGSGEESAWRDEKRRQAHQQNVLAAYSALDELFKSPDSSKNFRHITHTKGFFEGYLKWRNQRAGQII